MPNVFDPRYGNSRLIDQMTGTSYPTVRTVAENMPTIKHVSFYMPDLLVISQNMEVIGNISTSIETVINAHTDIMEFANRFGDVQAVVDLTEENVQATIDNLALTTAQASAAAGSALAANSAATAAAGTVVTVNGIADAAEQLLTEAGVAQSAAEAAAVRASEWANKVGAPVETDQYSARHWAMEAHDAIQQAVEDTISTLPSFAGASATDPGVIGLVPAPSAGEQNKVLSGAGTWVDLPEASGPSGSSGIHIITAFSNLKDVDPEEHPVVMLVNDTRKGIFRYDPADLSAKVTSDTREGFYIVPAGGTGSTGAWVRQAADVNIDYFGAVSLTTATAATGFDSTSSIQAALAYASTNKLHVVRVPDGIYRINGQLIMPRGTALHGPGPTIGVRWDPQTLNWDYQGGAILAITRAATAPEEQYATILMSTGTGLKGLGFWYPGQSLEGGTVTQFSWTIGNQPNPMEAAGTLEAEYVRDCHVTNAYKFLSWLNPQGPCDITNIKGFTIKEGFRFDNAYDILRMSDVHWNPIMVYVGHWPSNNVKDKTIAEQGTFITLYKADQAYFTRVFCWGPYHGLVMANSAQDVGPPRSANGCRFISCGFEGGISPLLILGDANGTTFYSLILGSSDYAGTGTSLRGNRALTVTPVTRINKLEFYDLTIFDTMDTYAAIENVDHLRIENGLWEGCRRIYPTISERGLVMNSCYNFSIKGLTMQRGTNITGVELNGCRGGIIWGNFFRGAEDERCIAINGSKGIRLGWNFNTSSPVGESNNIYNNPNNVDVQGDMTMINGAA